MTPADSLRERLNGGIRRPREASRAVLSRLLRRLRNSLCESPSGALFNSTQELAIRLSVRGSFVMRFERLEEDGMKASAPDFAWFQSLLSDIFQKSLSGRKTFCKLNATLALLL